MNSRCSNLSKAIALGSAVKKSVTAALPCRRPEVGTYGAAPYTDCQSTSSASVASTPAMSPRPKLAYACCTICVLVCSVITPSLLLSTCLPGEGRDYPPSRQPFFNAVTPGRRDKTYESFAISRRLGGSALIHANEKHSLVGEHGPHFRALFISVPNRLRAKRHRCVHADWSGVEAPFRR